MENIVFFAFMGALCSTDITAFGQFMLCRPIFCAPMVGFFMGNISVGLWLGMIAEIFWINAIPIGLVAPIDTSLIGILSTFWVCKYFTNLKQAAVFGLLLAVPFAYLYREIDIFGRNFNIKIMHLAEGGIQNGKYWMIIASVFAGLLFFITRAFLFYIFAMTVGSLIYTSIYIHFPKFVLLGFAKAWYLLPVAGFGVAIYNFNFKNIKALFLWNSSND
ncbi:MAG: PTS sugar transporter subunit IIC [Endomicrobium sp.]|jgi:PTS system mannose-specific IIC component|nr:PTS sugar transporter subunit IIC [Endomicrobium sp.]